jgi:hypothetical protein
MTEKRKSISNATKKADDFLAGKTPFVNPLWAESFTLLEEFADDNEIISMEIIQEALLGMELLWDSADYAALQEGIIYALINYPIVAADQEARIVGIFAYVKWCLLHNDGVANLFESPEEMGTALQNILTLATARHKARVERKAAVVDLAAEMILVNDEELHLFLSRYMLNTHNKYVDLEFCTSLVAALQEALSEVLARSNADQPTLSDEDIIMEMQDVFTGKDNRQVTLSDFVELDTEEKSELISALFEFRTNQLVKGLEDVAIAVTDLPKLREGTLEMLNALHESQFSRDRSGYYLAAIMALLTALAFISIVTGVPFPLALTGTGVSLVLTLWSLVFQEKKNNVRNDRALDMEKYLKMWDHQLDDSAIEEEVLFIQRLEGFILELARYDRDRAAVVLEALRSATSSNSQYLDEGDVRGGSAEG